MKAIESSELEKALKRKGFRVHPGGNHKLYYFYRNGKQTSVRVTISHGKKCYTDALLSYVCKQMELDKKQINEYVDCVLTEQKYRQILEGKGILPN